MKRLLNIIGVLLLMPLLAFGQQTTKKQIMRLLMTQW